MSYDLPSRGLVSQQDQSMTARPNVPRSKFMGAWTRKMTFDGSFLVPFLVDEILPGDFMKYDVTALVRMSTPLFPIFDNQRIETFFFFVPARLLWVNWVTMMGETPNPGEPINYTVPQIQSPAGGFAVNSLYDHFGIPCAGQIGAGNSIFINALPLRAYNQIYNQWFRDENLINSAAVQTDNGPDSPANYVLRKRAKTKDYFTAALPWPQKFSSPNVALTGQAIVRGLGVVGGLIPAAGANVWEGLQTTTTAFPNIVYGSVANAVAIRFNSAGAVGAANPPQVFADLASVAGITVNQLRQSFMLQELLERDARGGTRYVEILREHFGVTPQDARLQRPEYIGGGATPLTLTPVAQTAPVSGSGTVGNLGAAGSAAGMHRASYAAQEHGYIIGLINVKSDISYQQGLHPMWTRQTRYDFPWPLLTHLGEQVVYTRELYCTGAAGNDLAVFGYQERYQEFRTRWSEVTGQFRSTTPGTLDAWTLAERFTATPVLGQTFVEDATSVVNQRVMAAGALSVNQQYLADLLIRREAVRPLPMYGTPAGLGML